VKKANRIVYLVLALLFIVVAVLAILNRGDGALKRALEENREFQIRIDGEHKATIGLQALLDLDPQEFTTSFATSIAAPRDAVFRGVELRLVLESLGIDASDVSHYVVSGLDSYYSPLSGDEVAREGAVYICYSMDGEIMKTQGEGSVGPYMMVIRDSRFAQRWCKYVEAVDLILVQQGQGS